jgi:hypothetical protein
MTQREKLFTIDKDTGERKILHMHTASCSGSTKGFKISTVD